MDYTSGSPRKGTTLKKELKTVKQAARKEKHQPDYLPMTIQDTLIEEFRKKFVPDGYEGATVIDPLDLVPWLCTAFERVEQEAKREERERIAKAYEPVFNDFNLAAQYMIKTEIFKASGTEVIESIGYMKSVLSDTLKGEKHE